MTPETTERHAKARELLDGARELSADRWEEYLKGRCGSDSELASELMSLLVSGDTSRGTAAAATTPTASLASTAETGSLLMRAGVSQMGGAARCETTDVAEGPPHRWLDEALGWGPGDLLFSQYRVERSIRGGMAVVHICRHERLGRRVVLKIPAIPMGQWLERPVGQAGRFSEELGAWSRVGSHRNVLRLIDAVTWRCAAISGDRGEQVIAEVPALVIEYGGPRNLFEFARSSAAGGATPDQITAMLAQVALAMSYMHQRGVFPHLDLKPQNVLVGEDGVARVTDFGLAQTQGIAAIGAYGPADLCQTRILATEHGLVCGTPAYMAPEQWKGVEACDQRSDIYSFGVMACELLAGVHPFAEAAKAGLASLRAAHTDREPDLAPLSALPRFAECVRACTRKDPSERPGAWTEVLSLLPEEIVTPQSREAAGTPPRDRDLLRYAIVIRSIPSMERLVQASSADLRGSRELHEARALLARERGRPWRALAEVLRSIVLCRPVATDVAAQCLTRRMKLVLFALLCAALLSLQLLLTTAYVGRPMPNVWLAVAVASVLLFEARRLRRCPNCQRRGWWYWNRSAPRKRGVGMVGGVVLESVAVCRGCGMVRGEPALEKAPPRGSRWQRVDTVAISGVSCQLPRLRWRRAWPPVARFGAGLKPGSDPGNAVAPPVASHSLGAASALLTAAPGALRRRFRPSALLVFLVLIIPGSLTVVWQRSPATFAAQTGLLLAVSAGFVLVTLLPAWLAFRLARRSSAVGNLVLGICVVLAFIVSLVARYRG